MCNDIEVISKNTGSVLIDGNEDAFGKLLHCENYNRRGSMVSTNTGASSVYSWLIMKTCDTGYDAISSASSVSSSTHRYVQYYIYNYIYHDLVVKHCVLCMHVLCNW